MWNDKDLAMFNAALAEHNRSIKKQNDILERIARALETKINSEETN